MKLTDLALKFEAVNPIVTEWAIIQLWKQKYQHDQQTIWEKIRFQLNTRSFNPHSRQPRPMYTNPRPFNQKMKYFLTAETSSNKITHSKDHTMRDSKIETTP